MRIARTPEPARHSAALRPTGPVPLPPPLHMPTPSHPARARTARAPRPSALAPALAAAVAAAGLAACGDAPPTAPAGAPARRALVATGVPARTFCVEPVAGKDANPGTKALPFRSLGRALAAATAGDTVQLATGRHTSTDPAATSGDVYPLHVPDGVTVRGTLLPGGARGTVLSPAASAAHTLGLVLDGSANVQDLEMDVFGTAVDARQT